MQTATPDNLVNALFLRLRKLQLTLPAGTPAVWLSWGYNGDGVRIEEGATFPERVVEHYTPDHRAYSLYYNKLLARCIWLWSQLAKDGEFLDPQYLNVFVGGALDHNAAISGRGYPGNVDVVNVGRIGLSGVCAALHKLKLHHLTKLGYIRFNNEADLGAVPKWGQGNVILPGREARWWDFPSVDAMGARLQRLPASRPVSKRVC